MAKFQWKKWSTAILCGVLLTLTGCSPFNDYENRLEVFEKHVKDGFYNNKVDASVKAIRGLSAKSAYQSLLNEKWEKAYRLEAKKKIDDLTYQITLMRKLEGIERGASSRKKLAAQFNAINKASAFFNAQLQHELAEKKFLARAFDQQEEVLGVLNDSYGAFVRQVEATLAKTAAMAVKYPQQAKRLSSFDTQLAQFDTDYKRLSAFYEGDLSRHSESDFKAMHALYKKMGIEKNLPLTVAQDYVRMASQLEESYTKILVDMSEYHAVKIGFLSWDNFYDYPTEHTVQFPYVEVTAAQLSRVNARFGYEQTMFKNAATSDSTLRMATGNKIASSWPSGDDEASIWVEDSESEFTHTYVMIINGEQTLVEESVSEALYRKHQNDVGKSILTKPYGVFEDEVIDVATAPALAFVGNPQYGKWVDDGQGGQEWSWAPFFAGMWVNSLLSDFDIDYDRRYSRRDYRRHRDSMATYVPVSSRSGYRGTNQYGVTSASSSIQKSLTTGRSGTSALRGAGSSSRNQGPGRGK